MQTIKISSKNYFEDAFATCANVKSFSTNKPENELVLDFDYGDLIVGDFNFDLKEDVAIKNDSGGNGGPFYNFYLQSKNDTFILDEFLTKEMGHCPFVVDRIKKSLIVLTHADVGHQRELTYHYNPISSAWKIIKNKLIP